MTTCLRRTEMNKPLTDKQQMIVIIIFHSLIMLAYFYSYWEGEKPSIATFWSFPLIIFINPKLASSPYHKVTNSVLLAEHFLTVGVGIWLGLLHPASLFFPLFLSFIWYYHTKK